MGCINRRMQDSFRLLPVKSVYIRNIIHWVDISI